MIYEASPIAVVVFFIFVGITLGISFYLGGRAKSSQGYFAAHGQIPWFVNGVAFAGDYLSAASFLGICGMIAFHGYDGFLYSIGYLAGWIVALFVVAEPIKRLGKFTFADALDARFQSRGIKLAAGISTLAVSVFYLIPQMVGAGVLVKPLLGFPHWAGVMLVGATVITIVVTAGMVSTTWVQFLKGSLLVVFSAVLVLMILNRGFSTKPDVHRFQTIGPLTRTADATESEILEHLRTLEKQVGGELLVPRGPWTGKPYARFQARETGRISVWRIEDHGTDQSILAEAQTITNKVDGTVLVNGEPKGEQKGEPELHAVGHVTRLPGGQASGEPGRSLGQRENQRNRRIRNNDLFSEADARQPGAPTR